MNRDWGTDLEDLISLAAQLDRRIRERQAERGFRVVSYPPMQVSSPSPHLGSPASTVEEPMQIEGTRLSPLERQCCLEERLCLYCGKAGHFKTSCPSRPVKPEDQLRVSALVCPQVSVKQLLLTVTVSCNSGQVTVSALIEVYV